jgi:hypothetical protein
MRLVGSFDRITTDRQDGQDQQTDRIKGGSTDRQEYPTNLENSGNKMPGSCVSSIAFP